MYLQRTIGNQAVLRLLEQHDDDDPTRENAQADTGQSEITPLQTGESGDTAKAQRIADMQMIGHQTRQLQRKVGFEYQLTSSDVAHVAGEHQLKKGDKIGSTVKGVDPTVDVNQSEDYDLEFVSKAYDEDSEAGWKGFLDGIAWAATTTKLLSKAGRRPVSEVFAGGIDDHTIQVRGALGTVHITQGIQLDKLHKFLTEFGLRNRPISNREIHEEPGAQLADVAMETGDVAFNALEEGLDMELSGTARNEYKSLLGMIAGNMSLLGNSSGPYLKSYLKAMNRTDMGTIMKHVRERLESEIEANMPLDRDDELAELDLLDDLFVVPLSRHLNLGDKLIPTMPYNEDEDEWASSGLGEIVRMDYLDDIWDGNDQLSAKWQKVQAGQKKLESAMSEDPDEIAELDAAAASHSDAAEILESIGGYGSKTDHTGASLRPILEMRNISYVPAVSLEKWAKAFGTYMKNLNAGKETRPFYQIWQDIKDQ